MLELTNFNKEEIIMFKSYGFRVYIKVDILQYSFEITNNITIKTLNMIKCYSNKTNNTVIKVLYCKDYYKVNNNELLELIKIKLNE